MTLRVSRRDWLLVSMATGASAAAARLAFAAPPPAQIETAAWPHTITQGGATATIYEPQAISWPDLQTLTARAAVAITPAGAKEPFFGTIEMTVGTQADLDARSVVLTAPKLLSTHFPTLDAAQAARVGDAIRAVMAAMPAKRLPLDSILLSLKQQPHVGETALNNDPPKIYFSSRPASLVVFDGDPVTAPIQGSTLAFAVNTNWDVFKDAGGVWYLLNGGSWLQAPAAAGPWSAVAKLPAVFGKLPNDPNFAAVRKAVPGLRYAPGSAPEIFVSTVPAEIIVTAGPPKFVPVPGVSLQSVGNTESSLFLDPIGGRFYYLVSGRWFSAPGLDGPWIFATPNLPADFAKIPADGALAPVLASVPGTQQAQLAVIQAQIPRQATLKRSATITVTYGGPPKFAPIPGTGIEYAVNTHDDVLRIGGVYYACFQGAWFKSAAPTGPWVPADSVPHEVLAIPPSSPLYPVTYVRVYAATPEAVTYGYTAGYVMGFVSAGVVAYGTGYYYPPVIVPGVVPGFYPYPYSYAGGVRYNTATGAWVRGGAVYGPYGGAGAWSAYNPSTGSYAHGSAAWGPNGGSANASWYNARSGVSGSTNQNANPYGRWGASTFSGPNATVHTQSGSNARGSAGGFSSSTGAEGAGVRGANGNKAGVAKGANGDVYAGGDGNVYRHDSSGWSKYDNGSWNPVQKPNTSTRNGSTQATSAAATRSTQAANPQAQKPASANTRQPSSQSTAASRSSRPAQSSSSYGQLEQDRQARSYGGRQQQRYGGGARGSQYQRRYR